MDVLNLSSKERETYEVEINYSILWESALGIAAITNTRLLNTLEKQASFWDSIKSSLSAGILKELNYVEENNTWKALLLLLHVKDFKSLKEFTSYIDELSAEELRLTCMPYLGIKHQYLRQSASLGDLTSLQKMKEIAKDNPFYPAYIDFVCQVDADKLKQHLTKIMSVWVEEVITTDKQKEITKILQADYESKSKMKETLNSFELVEWATGGVTYHPEPSVTKVLLIPQYIYRPWNIEADLEGTKVFYYPVANESITPEDPYTPNHSLVLKYKALGDEVRLRMVKMLYENDHTLQEITDHLNLGKSTVHHHLKILRSARIVAIKDNKYTLKRKPLDSIYMELNSFLNQ